MESRISRPFLLKIFRKVTPATRSAETANLPLKKFLTKMDKTQRVLNVGYADGPEGVSKSAVLSCE